MKTNYNYLKKRPNALKHGMNKSKFYQVWQQMKNRCSNPNNNAYKYYGARGIAVCDRWQKFEHFAKDMLNGYSQGLTLERVNNNGNYCPENCTWIPNSLQARNSRRVKIYKWKGQDLTLRQIAQKEKLPYDSIWRKIKVENLDLATSVEKVRSRRKELGRGEGFKVNRLM